MTAVIIVPMVLAPAGQISGPGSPDGSQGTYWWYRDNKWTKKGSFWANKGHLKLKPGRTYVFTWTEIDDSQVKGTKDAWQVFVQDVGKPLSHGWESIILQVRDDEPWTGPDRVIRAFVSWSDLGQQAWPVPQGILDLRLTLTQTDATNKIWHIEAWYNVGVGWVPFVDKYTEIGGDGDLTQAAAAIQIDKDSGGTLYFHPASPLSHSK